MLSTIDQARFNAITALTLTLSRRERELPSCSSEIGIKCKTRILNPDRKSGPGVFTRDRSFGRYGHCSRGFDLAVQLLRVVLHGNRERLGLAS
jgi:hypothetical protein